MTLTSDQLRALQQVKEELQKATCLSFFGLSFLDETSHLQISTDASDSAAGAFLEQVNRGITSPVAFI